MINLDNSLWQTLEGGYKIIYDVSIPLRELEITTDSQTIENIWKELWDELHHQGNVGLASYLAVPQLARIATARNFYNWNLLGICCVIEQQRQLNENPQLPVEFENYYKEGLQTLKQFVIDNLNKEASETTFRMALATLAVCSGQVKLSKAITEMEGDIMEDFLEQF